MVIEQGHTRLKFTNKQGIDLGNSDWIAGVDHDNTCQNDQHDSSEDKESNSDNEDHMPEAETGWESSDDKSEKDENEQCH